MFSEARHQHRMLVRYQMWVMNRYKPGIWQPISLQLSNCVTYGGDKGVWGYVLKLDPVLKAVLGCCYIQPSTGCWSWCCVAPVTCSLTHSAGLWTSPSHPCKQWGHSLKPQLPLNSYISLLTPTFTFIGQWSIYVSIYLYIYLHTYMCLAKPDINSGS